MVNLMVWLAVGGAIGWLASMVMNTDNQLRILLNVVVGVVGAVVAGWMTSPLGAGAINQDNFSLSSLVMSVVGAVILLTIVNLFGRGAMR